MDLNRLYFDHQLLLMQAARAPTEAMRRNHEIAAARLAGLVRNTQKTLGASAAGAWDALAAVADCSAAMRQSPVA